MYDILNHMTGEILFTHQLPRAGRACAPDLLRQFPSLADPLIEKDLDEAFAAGPTPQSALERVIPFLVSEHGEWFDVEQLPQGVYEAMGPVAELVQMREQKD